jgi:hypothetical protein
MSLILLSKFCELEFTAELSVVTPIHLNNFRHEVIPRFFDVCLRNI